MHNQPLSNLVVIFAVAVAMVLLLRRIGVPSIAGFILAGMIVGPHSLGLVSDPDEVLHLAEIGVALLLFGIGMELSLDSVRRLWQAILLGGGLQVIVTTGVAAAIFLALGVRAGVAVLLGCVVAVSSTAVVLSVLRSRGEIDAPHGRVTLGILLFQDLCVVPMILVIPLLAGGPASPLTLLWTVAKAVVVIAAVIVGARLVVPRFLGVIARTRQRDLFVLSVFLVSVGTAWLVSTTGVSLALGAFLAGLVVAGSEYRHQAMSDLVPFREVFASLFFVSVGMLLSPASIAANAASILLMLAAIIVGKGVIATMAGLALRIPLRVCVLAGLALAQAGEFSFVLLSSGRGAMTMPQPLTDNLTVAVILSMLLAPLVIAAAPRLSAGVGWAPAITRRLGVRTPGERAGSAATLRDHVIIAGYGLAGQDLAQSLEDVGIPFLVVDLNAENVRRAIQQTMPAYFGDVTSPEVLELLGARNARELVIVINDAAASERAVHAARSVAPDLPVLVRARYATDVGRLFLAGATQVIVSELEASVEITRRVLDRHRVAPGDVTPQIQRIREHDEAES
jgi:monovalent cation:H+ antiporter-2, CPA2 family